MAFNAELAQRQLIQMYQQAYMQLLNTIITKQARGNATAFYGVLIRDIERILGQLNFATDTWAQTALPKIYRQGIAIVNQTLVQAGQRPGLTLGLAGVHRRSIEVIAQNFTMNMRDATQYVGRHIRDEWRRTTLEVITGREATGDTLREAKQNFLHRIGEQGLEAFRDVRGRHWRLDAYADMAVRSTGREATNVAQLNQIREVGNDLVQFTEHSNPCEICAPLEGRVYSISGEDPRYPALDIAFGEGYANIHPNCRHSLRAYIPDLDDAPRETLQKSNRSFERDPRSQAEKERYEAEQSRRAAQRATRLQWEKYRAWLPDDTPTTLSAFGRMKAAGSERYNELQQLFRQVRAEQ